MRKFFGLVTQSFSMSMKNIIGNKMRSFLTMLGIIIGVTAVIALITIVQGVSSEMMSSFTEMGAGLLSVNASGNTIHRGLSDKDLEKLAAIDNVKGVSPNVSYTASAVYKGQITKDVSVQGKNDQYFINNDVIAYGRALYKSDMGGDVNVCVIDTKFQKNLFTGENPIGKSVNIGGFSYRVVGVQSDDGGGVTANMFQSTNGGSVMIPYKVAMRASGTAFINSVDVYVDDVDRTNETQRLLENVLDDIFYHKDNSYWVMNLNSILAAMDQMLSLLTGVLAGVASIALIVGGIGIMNMMLVSVTERTREIGLRKALGATPARIQIQFLIEAMFLSLAGGLIGIVVGVAISAIVAASLDMGFVLSVSAIQLGVGFSAAVGLLFGWAPAKKASELNPIDALRSD